MESVIFVGWCVVILMIIGLVCHIQAERSEAMKKKGHDFLVELDRARDGRVFCRIRFASNRQIFMTSETYNNIEHVEEKAEQLAKLLKVEVVDYRAN